MSECRTSDHYIINQTHAQVLKIKPDPKPKKGKRPKKGPALKRWLKKKRAKHIAKVCSCLIAPNDRIMS
jgi:hypothetical protein